MEIAKIIAKKKTGPQASRNPCGWKPSRPAPYPFWKISRATPNAAPVASRFVRTPRAAITGARRATSRSRNPSASTTPITSGVFAASACSRSWFSATVPPTRAPAGRSARSRSIVAPTAGLEGSRRRDRLDQGEAFHPARPPDSARCRDRAWRLPGDRRAVAAARRSGAPRARRRRRPAAPGCSRRVTRRLRGRP